jgi:hypothetical protein
VRRSPSPARRAVFWKVLVGEQLDDHEELGGIPPDIWVVVLGFVRHAVLPEPDIVGRPDYEPSRDENSGDSNEDNSKDSNDDSNEDTGEDTSEACLE